MAQVCSGGEFYDLSYKKNHTKIEFPKSIRQFSFSYRLPDIRNVWMNPRIIIVIIATIVIIIVSFDIFFSYTKPNIKSSKFYRVDNNLPTLPPWLHNKPKMYVQHCVEKAKLGQEIPL